ncbi:MAG: hypothetical protein EBU46_19030, partial [Nitrosomonadaceae bacterium]|nr:hypothetical protein [Nitrosomonadaceae bacterium]
GHQHADGVAEGRRAGPHRPARRPRLICEGPEDRGEGRRVDVLHAHLELQVAARVLSGGFAAEAIYNSLERLAARHLLSIMWHMGIQNT